MKVVINGEYGGFCLSAYGRFQYEQHLKSIGKLEPKQSLNMDEYFSKEVRTDPYLIQLIENNGPEIYECYCEPKIVEIPDEASDWKIYEFDGLEWIVYVMDGKIMEAE